MELLARAQYAAFFLKSAPQQEIPVPTPKAAMIVEAVMIDLWHQFTGRSGCVETEQVAFASWLGISSIASDSPITTSAWENKNP